MLTFTSVLEASHTLAMRAFSVFGHLVLVSHGRYLVSFKAAQNGLAKRPIGAYIRRHSEISSTSQEKTFIVPSSVESASEGLYFRLFVEGLKTLTTLFGKNQGLTSHRM